MRVEPASQQPVLQLLLRWMLPRVISTKLVSTRPLPLEAISMGFKESAMPRSQLNQPTLHTTNRILKKASLRVKGPDRPSNRGGCPNFRLKGGTKRITVKYVRPKGDDGDFGDDDDGFVYFTTRQPTALLAHLELFIFVSSGAPTLNIDRQASDLPLIAAAITGGRANSLTRRTNTQP
jgi:hypothetical protein